MEEKFGTWLRNQRELRGVTLEEISSATKIPQRFLKALEEDDLGELPGEVFVKGYIRAYANSIGADPGEALMAYDEAVVKPRCEKVKHQWQVEAASRRKKRYFIAGVIAAVLVSGMIAAVILFDSREAMDPGSLLKDSINDAASGSVSAELKPTAGIPQLDADSYSEKELLDQNQESGASDEADKADEADEGPGDAESVQISGEEILETEPAQSVENGGEAENLEPAPAASQDMDKEFLARNPENDVTIQANTGISGEDSEEKVKPLRLVIRAGEKGWFNLIVDESDKKQDFILPAGTSKEIFADSSIQLWIGNKQGLELILNDKVLTLPESADNVIKDFVVTAKLLE